MFARIMCPACQHKMTIPEGDMGKRHVCPNCQSPFLAGKSIPEDEPDVPMRYEPAADPSFNKTMLGEEAPPIKYACPRCKAPLEAPVSEAGTKKPCPKCGQRLQVPATPPPPPPVPSLQKTMLAETQPPIKYNCPNCKKPLESPASEAGTKKPCPYCSQRLQVPAAAPAGPPQPNLNKTLLATDESKAPGAAAGYPAGAATVPAAAAPGAAAPKPPFPVPGKLVAICGLGLGGLVLILLLACVIPAVIRGGKSEDSDKMAQMQKELEKLRAQIESDKLLMDKQKQFEADQRTQWDKLLAAQKLKEENAQRDWEALQKNQEYLDNKKLMAKAKAEYDEKQRELNDAAKKLELQRQKDDADNKARLDDLARKLADAQKSTTIIQQAPPPVIYYPPYHPGYYRPWWW